MVKLIFTGILLIGVSAYYTLNSEPDRIGPEIKPIELAAFSLPKNNSVKDSSSIETALSSLKGITGSAINRKSGIVSITYYPDQLNPDRLQKVLSSSVGSTISKHQFPKVANGCPFHEGGTFSWLGKLFN